MGYSLKDFSDVSILHAVMDYENGGFASLEDIASALGQEDNIKGLAQRLAWMKRFGFVDGKRANGGLSKWRVRKATVNELESIGSLDSQARAASQRRNKSQMTLMRRTVNHYYMNSR